jgi:glutaredoxin
MRLFTLLLLMVCATTVFAGKVYQWKDENGQVHFGDRPPAGTKKQSVDIRVNTIETPAIYKLKPGETRSSLRSSTSAAGGTRRVVMFSAEWCGVCKRAKRYFRSQSIAFTEHDIEKSASAARDFKQLGGRGVPLILVGDSKLFGFSQASFNRLYRR